MFALLAWLEQSPECVDDVIYYREDRICEMTITGRSLLELASFCVDFIFHTSPVSLQTHLPQVSQLLSRKSKNINPQRAGWGCLKPSPAHVKAQLYHEHGDPLARSRRLDRSISCIVMSIVSGSCCLAPKIFGMQQSPFHCTV